MAYAEGYETPKGEQRWRGVALHPFDKSRQSSAKNPRTGAFFTDKRSALQWASLREDELRQAAAEIGDNFTVYKRKPVGASMTVGDYVDRWLADTGGRAETTQDRYRCDAKNMRALVGDIGLAELSRDDVKAARDRLIADGWKRSTVKRAIVMLGTLMREAVGEGLRSGDPTLKVTVKLDAMPVPWEIIGGGDFETLCAAMPEQLRPMLLCGYDTGLRVGEVLALRVSSIDTKRNHLRVDGTVRQGKWKPVTKNSHRRTVWMPARLRDALIEHVRRNGLRGDAFLFARPDGKPLASSGFYPPWHAAREQAGHPTLRFHDLRHTFCTGLAQKAAPLREIGALAGHESPRSTLAYVQRQEADDYGRRWLGGTDEGAA